MKAEADWTASTPHAPRVACASAGMQKAGFDAACLEASRSPPRASCAVSLPSSRRCGIAPESSATPLLACASAPCLAAAVPPGAAASLRAHFSPLSAVSSSTMASAAAAPQSRGRRDKLLGIEEAVAARWAKANPYEVDAPAEHSGDKVKYFCSFPYPYMNGKMHLGHAFTVCRAEFQARFQRMQGKAVLWPFGLHCTGMPILACADKLKREVAQRQANEQRDGTLENEKKEHVEEQKTGEEEAKKRKSKVAAKTGDAKTQWNIMESMGIPQEEIAAFADAQHWLRYFPPLAKRDLSRFGLAVDWRRSFVTTDINPFYDAFIRWQFNTLMKRGKLKFGMRATIFSRREKQACADHDRASGEGVGPQEYTVVKLFVQEAQLRDEEAEQLQPLLEILGELQKHGEKRVSLVAATLRPETMYGQTNCYVLPEGKYGVYLAFSEPRKSLTNAGSEDGGAAAAQAAAETEEEFETLMTREEALKACSEVFICSERSAINMGYQGLLPMEANAADADALPLPHCLGTVEGRNLIGVPLLAPNATYPTIYALPMLTISMNKGTGVVMSVPSDAPDDYMALMDIVNKPDFFRDRYGVRPEWVKPFEPVPIIDIPGLGSQAAVRLCQEKKVASQKDTQKLAEIKEEVYKKGFYDGVLLVGPFAGQKVADAKNAVRDAMIAKKDAIAYFEPEKSVVSRSGDECVVAYMNQWYLDYGEESWRDAVEKYICSPEFHTYNPQVLHQFKHVVGWLREWACSRSYGLGTFLPWTKDASRPVLIESLSDSTIYMAYYTIAHLLQGTDMYGEKPGPLGITVEQLTDEVFDYIFVQTNELPQSSIPTEHLKRMRAEFEYWYPLDLRVSGKDLIFNHLTFSLYNHVAMWPDRPDLWPKAFVCNGHVMVDAQKMSKSLGNFITIEDGINEFSADAMRVALADAGDTADDSNFQRETANSAIMRLYLLEQFANEVVSGVLPLREGAFSDADRLFLNEIVTCTEIAKEAFETFQYREALKNGLYELHTRRDQYRMLCGDDHMHKDLVLTWLKTQCQVLSPIAPHISEHIWSEVLKESSLIVSSAWPTFPDSPQDPVTHRQFLLLLAAVEDFRRTKEKAVQMLFGGKKKGQQPKAPSPAVSALTHAVVYVAKEYPALQQQVLTLLQKAPVHKGEDGTWCAGKEYMDIVKNDAGINALDKNAKKEAMAFASFQMRDELKAYGRSALDLQLPFDELQLLQTHQRYLQTSLGLTEIAFLPNDQVHSKDESENRKLAKPGKPSIFFYSA
ncbi:leucyl-tRNA synthetase [Besnoitia besnoiti]|uniref:leucine--tRNA ligase n=1 Tax=Besnoitia besnoiti TaxID=94643 RepID=A0A2A9M2S0_BESBE|nr:leucyl-tRNA synthetase [Besnoitia besnoiti]PFH31514.1 leucyl-tRNA synthetase [Besnoitia besnoiti]